jgi:pyridoxamine 5'-phosphate oxidase
MTKDQILALINRNPTCAIATTDGNKPRVRSVMILRADQGGILFNTGKTKDLYRQIVANPEVELCFFDQTNGVQVRVSGRMEEQRDADTIALVLAKLPFLKPIVEARGTEMLAPYLLKQGRATVWTMATNMEPKTFVDL